LGRRKGDNIIMCADNTIKLNPATSVLQYKVGDEITLNEAEFLCIFYELFTESKGCGCLVLGGVLPFIILISIVRGEDLWAVIGLIFVIIGALL
jgi:hypothetical protein